MLLAPTLIGATSVGLLAALWAGLLFPSQPAPSDPDVAALGRRFDAAIADAAGLAVTSRGALRRDRDTTFWSLFTDVFGSNPNTPYMWNALPLLGFLLPSPMWSLGREDAVVLICRVPPKVDYFSFTTFALFVPRRLGGQPLLPFSSLGDSVNNLNVKATEDGLFAHVVASSRRTYELVEQALVSSGLPASAINLAVVPAELGLLDEVFHLGGQARHRCPHSPNPGPQQRTASSASPRPPPRAGAAGRLL